MLFHCQGTLLITSLPVPPLDEASLHLFRKSEIIYSAFCVLFLF